MKEAKQFCGQGLWLIEGELYVFKEAFMKIYRRGEDESMER